MVNSFVVGIIILDMNIHTHKSYKSFSWLFWKLRSTDIADYPFNYASYV